MKKKLLLTLLTLATMATSVTAQQQYTRDQIRNSMVSAGFDNEAIQQYLAEFDTRNPALTDMFMTSIADANDPIQRSARYQTPDFTSAAIVMLDRYQEQLKLCKKAKPKPEAYKKDEKYGIFKTEYILPVMETIDEMGINGFNLENLDNLRLNPQANKALQEALVMKYNKKKPQKNIQAVAQALQTIYADFATKVKAKYGIKEQGDQVSANLYTEYGNAGLPMTFTNGKITKIGNVTVPFSLKAPNTVRNGLDFGFTANTVPWLNIIDDEELWRAVFTSPLWTTDIRDNGDIVLMSTNDKSGVTGVDKDYIAAQNMYKSPNNELFVEWYAPYANLSIPTADVKDNSNLVLNTAKGKYNINPDHSITAVDRAADKVFASTKKQVIADATEAKNHEAIYAPRSYIEVTGIRLNNVTRDQKLISTLSDGAFYDADMRFIQPVIDIVSHTRIDRKIKLYYRIINPDSTINRSSSSPLMYTNSSTFNITPDTRELTFLGWGKANQSNYAPGAYKIQIYSEKGELLGERMFKIDAKVPEAEITKCWLDPLSSHDGQSGIKVHIAFIADGLKGKPIKYTLKMSKGKSTYQYSTTLTPSFDKANYKDEWIFVSTSTLREKFGTDPETPVRYEVVLTDAAGNILSAKSDMSFFPII